MTTAAEGFSSPSTNEMVPLCFNRLGLPQVLTIRLG